MNFEPLSYILISRKPPKSWSLGVTLCCNGDARTTHDPVLSQIWTSAFCISLQSLYAPTNCGIIVKKARIVSEGLIIGVNLDYTNTMRIMTD